MSEEKIKITQDLIEGFSRMFTSNDVGDIVLATDILKNRDTSDPESEKNFKEITKLITSENLFPVKDTYVIKCNGKVMMLKGGYGKSIFTHPKNAKAALSRHLTDYIGTKKGNFDYRTEQRVNSEAFWRSTPPGTVSAMQRSNNNHQTWASSNGYGNPNNPYKAYYIPYNYSNHSYDPNFDAEKFKKEKRDEVAKQLGKACRWLDDDDPKKKYFTAIKMIFGGGIELRDFLLENKVVTIEQI